MDKTSDINFDKCQEKNKTVFDKANECKCVYDTYGQMKYQCDGCRRFEEFLDKNGDFEFVEIKKQG